MLHIVSSFFKLTVLPILCIFLLQCHPRTELHQVSVKEFKEFVEATQYITDAERFGWSFIQDNVVEFHIDHGIDWRIPDGNLEAPLDFPITQVSYNDAIAYCQWAQVSLPTYKQYWQLAEQDNRPINKSSLSILPIAQVNIVGNVWEITSTVNEKNEIRLAGGSYLCDESTCNGTNPTRINFVDKTTGNTNIGFAVIRKASK